MSISISESTGDLATVSDVNTSLAEGSTEYTISAKQYTGGDFKYFRLYVPVYDSSYTASLNIDKECVTSPSMATTVSGSTTNLYLAYYNTLNDEIRFKWGTYSDTTCANSGLMNHQYGYGGSAHSSTSYGQIYGNGTANPFLGYAITSGSTGYIETAQMQ